MGLVQSSSKSGNTSQTARGRPDVAKRILEGHATAVTVFGFRKLFYLGELALWIWVF